MVDRRPASEFAIPNAPKLKMPRPGVEPGLEVPETSVMSFSLPGRQGKNQPKLYVICSSGSTRRRSVACKRKLNVSSRAMLDELRLAGAVVLLALCSSWRLQ